MGEIYIFEQFSHSADLISRLRAVLLAVGGLIPLTVIG
jgi:hypothetical protein